MSPEMVELVLYAVIAAVVITRLHGIIGKTGGAGATLPRKEALNPSVQKNVVTLSKDEYSRDMSDEDIRSLIKGDDHNVVFNNIKKLMEKSDGAFSMSKFLAGAEKTYEKILKYFAAGNKEELSKIAERQVYEILEKKIDSRTDANLKRENTLVSIRECNICNISEGQKGSISILIRFLSEQINIIKDADGNLKSGSTSNIELIEDRILFRKEQSVDSRWKVAEISAL